VLAAVPVLLAIAVKASGTRSGGEGPDFFAAITDNGLFVALAALGVELGLFLPIAVAAISADAIAGEAHQGTLRYLLTVPADEPGCSRSSTPRSSSSRWWRPSSWPPPGS